MSWRKTLIFGVVLLGLAAFYYLYEIKFLGEREEAQKRARKVFAIKKEEVRDILLRMKGKGYEIWRKGEDWVIRYPLKARGDKEVIERLLDDLLKAEEERMLGERGEELKAFGLSPPRAEIVLKGEEREGAVLIGGENPAHTAVYAMRRGEKDVFLLSLHHWFQIDKKLYDLRDKTILSFDLQKVKGMEVTYRGNKLRLKKEGQEWRMIFPVVAKADKDAIVLLLEKLKDGRVKKFVDESPGALRPFGLLSPHAEVWIDEEGRKGIRFGRTDRREEGVYAQVAGTKNVFLVDISVASLLPKEAYDWRDKKIFTFDNTQVTKLALRYKGAEVVCENVGPDQWEISSPKTKRFKADPNKVNGFLWDLKGIKVKAFLPYRPGHKVNYGFSPPRGVVKVRLKGEERPTTLIIGRILQGRADRIYASKEGEKEVYLLARSSLEIFQKSIKAFQYRKILSFERDKVEEIEVCSPQRKVLLAKKGKEWRLKIPEGEIEGWKATSLLWHLEDLEYEDELKGADKLNLWGLDPPLYKVRICLKGGKEVSLYMGKEVPQIKGRIYALNPAENKPYIIKKEFIDTLKKYFFEAL
ncbi:MAG: DUF4340 domain-containing protein [Deltaproteobacteria bacterium]|nr:DUF4340 domain-containing protein [Deltaproteobacteria bacterium]